jgi:hypothetical protein
MILFYSDYCQHCNILLDTIKRHDTEKKIKLVSIDLLRSMKKNIDPKIHSVPALMFPTTKELIFGKAVFDYLLLPNRGVLFAKKMTREKADIMDKDIININTIIKNNDVIDEPMAFSLGTVASDNYSNIDDNDTNSLNINNNINYKWTTLEGDVKTNNINITSGNNIDNKISNDTRMIKKLPTIEEIMQEREKAIM